MCSTTGLRASFKVRAAGSRPPAPRLPRTRACAAAAAHICASLARGSPRSVCLGRPDRRSRAADTPAAARCSLAAAAPARIPRHACAPGPPERVYVLLLANQRTPLPPTRRRPPSPPHTPSAARGSRARRPRGQRACSSAARASWRRQPWSLMSASGSTTWAPSPGRARTRSASGAATARDRCVRQWRRSDREAGARAQWGTVASKGGSVVCSSPAQPRPAQPSRPRSSIRQPCSIQQQQQRGATFLCTNGACRQRFQLHPLGHLRRQPHTQPLTHPASKRATLTTGRQRGPGHARAEVALGRRHQARL